MEKIRIFIYFFIKNFAENGLIGKIFNFVFPHIFIHKGSCPVYHIVGCSYIDREPDSYNLIRCANSKSWHPFGYFPQYEKSEKRAKRRWGNLSIFK